MILSEFSRIMDHIIAVSTNVVDLGAITPYFVMFRAREDIYELLEACCGARLTVSYVRIGGLAQDVPDDFEARCRKAIASVRDVWQQGNDLLTRNIIFQKRFKDVGVMDKDEALAWGWVGPCLRGSGVAYDIRKDQPYSGYEQLRLRRARWARRATASTATWCAWKRSSRACASSSRRSRSCPRDR